MRLGLALICVLGCKDPPGRPAPGLAPGTEVAPVAARTPAPSAAPALPQTPTPAQPDAEWTATATHAIEAVAPEVEDLHCDPTRRACDGTVTAASEDELVRNVDRLRSDQSLRGAEVESVKLIGEPTTVGGRHRLQIAIQFAE